MSEPIAVSEDEQRDMIRTVIDSTITLSRHPECNGLVTVTMIGGDHVVPRWAANLLMVNAAVTSLCIEMRDAFANGGPICGVLTEKEKTEGEMCAKAMVDIGLKLMGVLNGSGKASDQPEWLPDSALQKEVTN